MALLILDSSPETYYLVSWLFFFDLIIMLRQSNWNGPPVVTPSYWRLHSVVTTETTSILSFIAAVKLSGICPCFNYNFISAFVTFAKAHNNCTACENSHFYNVLCCYLYDIYQVISTVNLRPTSKYSGHSNKLNQQKKFSWVIVAAQRRQWNCQKHNFLAKQNRNKCGNKCT